MELITRQALDQYLAADCVAAWMDAFAQQGDETLTCQKWLRESPAKRLIFDRLYGDLIEQQSVRRVLDVGGGLTAFTRRMAVQHDYHLVDILAHDAVAADAMEKSAGRVFLSRMDWFKFEPDGIYDVVVANDLFPNVDQRLELFIEKFLPRATEIRLSLTYYNKPRFYTTRRVDADEVFCMLAWNGDMTVRTLRKVMDRISQPNFDLFAVSKPSVFPNGRDVCVLTLQGSPTGYNSKNVMPG